MNYYHSLLNQRNEAYICLPIIVQNKVILKLRIPMTEMIKHEIRKTLHKQMEIHFCTRATLDSQLSKGEGPILTNLCSAQRGRRPSGRWPGAAQGSLGLGPVLCQTSCPPNTCKVSGKSVSLGANFLICTMPTALALPTA